MERIEIMDMHGQFPEKSRDKVAHILLDTLLLHTQVTIYNAMLFMSDEAQDKLVEEISNKRDEIQSVRIKSNKDEDNE